MKIEMGKKYRFNSPNGVYKGKKIRRVLVIDAEGRYPVVVELEGGMIETFSAAGGYWGDTRSTSHPENNLVEVKENEE